MTGTIDGAVNAVNPRATRGQLARDLTRARGRIVALVAIVDAHAATIKKLRDECRRLRRIAHELTR